MFADRYIAKNIVYPAFIEAEPLPSLSMIVMIPCLNEPDILRTLESLWACDPVESSCEVIVAVNNSEVATEAVKIFNQDTYEALLDWKEKNDRSNLILHPFYAKSVVAKHAGAGMARKIGMDEAIRRFNAINRPEGIIISLDSDCLVSSNYLSRIETVFAENKSCFATTINFSHRIEELQDQKQRLGIELYEAYLHYYKRSLDYIGFPNSIYTIGSAFAVRADAYVKQGGMNRRQAGEDFYFLYKLTQLGQLMQIMEAFVYPSARISDRVPFGTGAALTKWMDDSGDLLMTYNFKAFSDLKQLFDRLSSFYKADSKYYSEILVLLPQPIQEYLANISFGEKIDEINRNSSTLESFQKRFYQTFDGLMILRFLNHVHVQHYPFQNLHEAISLLSFAVNGSH